MNPDPRRFSPAAARNKQPILDVLQRVLPPSGRALEIASGSGEHAGHFANGLPEWTWQPTEVDPEAFASIEGWRAHSRADNLLPPRIFDATAAPHDDFADFDAIFCANMIHIAPWSACRGVMDAAARCLAPRGMLVLYGPFLFDDGSDAASNLAFDADLRARDPAWGVRRLADVVAEAARVGRVLRECVAMPANNLVLVFAREE